MHHAPSRCACLTDRFARRIGATCSSSCGGVEPSEGHGPARLGRHRDADDKLWAADWGPVQKSRPSADYSPSWSRVSRERSQKASRRDAALHAARMRSRVRLNSEDHERGRGTRDAPAASPTANPRSSRCNVVSRNRSSTCAMVRPLAGARRHSAEIFCQKLGNYADSRACRFRKNFSRPAASTRSATTA